MKDKYGLGFIKIEKKTGKIIKSFFNNADQLFLTASTMKVVFAGLFYEYCSAWLQKEVIIKEEDKFIGGILCNLNHPCVVSYELAIQLMITISDNTATNIILDKLQEQIGNPNIILQDIFLLKNTKILDIRTQDKNNVLGNGRSTPREFSLLLKHFLFTSQYSKEIKNMLNNQYLRGRGLRYFDHPDIISSGNKTGQLDYMINDCGYLETETHLYLYNIFYHTPLNPPYEYGVENPYYKKISKIIYEIFHQHL